MENVLKEFAALNKIPRPSKHEEAVAAYLEKRCLDMGFSTLKDSANNVIVEAPATKGFEDFPLIILQAHMDMVCVGGEGYNPKTDPIITVIEGDRIKAQGTSLGADDGIGVAMIMAILSSSCDHGPLRCIFTTDEESGMSGAQNLDEVYLDAPFLINLDWEEADTLCTGCAGCLTVIYQKELTKETMEGEGLTLSVSGLRGGHSGCEIHENRGNALKLLGDFLSRLVEKDIPFSLADFCGGKALNVIAPQGKTEVIVDSSQIPVIEDLFKAYSDEMKKKYPEDKGLTLECTPNRNCKEGYLPGDSRDIALFFGECPYGVKAMSRRYDNLVATSNNWGIVSSEKGISLLLSFRSEEDSAMAAFSSEVEERALAYGFTVEVESQSPAWTKKDEGKLESLANSVYASLYQKSPLPLSVHAGLECSYFAQKNPELDMISIGPTIHQCHSVEEVLYLNTIAPMMAWMKEIFKKINIK